MQDPNSNYSINPWMQDVPIPVKLPGYYSQDQELRYEALVSQLSLSDDQIRATRPPLRITPFPPRFGYPRREPTIMDVLSVGAESDFLLQDTATRQDSGQPGTLTPAQSPW